MCGLDVDQVLLAILAIMKEDTLHIVDSKDAAEIPNRIKFFVQIYRLPFPTGTGRVWDRGIIDEVLVVINQIPVALPSALDGWRWHVS